ncbi:uncharacterized protein ABDE67_007071 [Symphorus nematophorus]
MADSEQGSLSVTVQFKWTERLTDKLIRWRAANQSLFTGRRHAAIRGFEAFVNETGLQGVLSPAMAKKKWENLKQKYKELKNPPEGMEIFCQSTSWRWFDLMEEAMSGRLAGSTTTVQPSLLDEDHNAAMPQAFPGVSVVEMGTLDGVGTLGEVLELSGIKMCGEVKVLTRPESSVEVSADGADVMETQPALNTSPTVGLYATLLPDCTAKTNKTSPSSKNNVREAAAVSRKLVELQKERQALERDQAEFDTELISLERERALLNKDMVTLERDRATTERDRAAVERDRAALERDRAALERDRVFLDRDRAFLERDRARLERDRVYLERAREELDRERALFRRETAVLGTDGMAVDGDPADVTTEREVVLQTRFYQRLMAADLAPDQLETRQRLVSLFQKLVEKM